MMLPRGRAARLAMVGVVALWFAAAELRTVFEHKSQHSILRPASTSTATDGPRTPFTGDPTRPHVGEPVRFYLVNGYLQRSIWGGAHFDRKEGPERLEAKAVKMAEARGLRPG